MITIQYISHIEGLQVELNRCFVHQKSAAGVGIRSQLNCVHWNESGCGCGQRIFQNSVFEVFDLICKCKLIEQLLYESTLTNDSNSKDNFFGLSNNDIFWVK